jgi:hypothetical protein
MHHVWLPQTQQPEPLNATYTCKILPVKLLSVQTDVLHGVMHDQGSPQQLPRVMCSEWCAIAVCITIPCALLDSCACWLTACLSQEPPPTQVYTGSIQTFFTNATK